jgi:hypothetical protein
MALAETTRAGVEDELREAMLTGRLVDWRTGDATADDPAHSAGWDAQRTVPGALLAKLLTDTEVQPRPRALRLAGARVVGQLDLEAAELVCPLLLRACWFAEPAVLSEAKAPALLLPGCHLPGLSAARLTTRGDLRLGDGFTAGGGVRLGRAHIGGQLDLSGATLTNPDGSAFDLQELRTGVLLIRDMNDPPELVDFTHAQVGALVDVPASWPRQAVLDGFVYDALYEDRPISARQRLGWLAHNPRGYSPSPTSSWPRCTAVPAATRTPARSPSPSSAPGGAPSACPRGCGACWWTGWSAMATAPGWPGCGCWSSGWSAGWCSTASTPNQELVLATPGETHPGFHGAVYALDTLLPVVDLRQQAVWIPRGGVQWWAWASILAGWVLTMAVVAALSGLLKRD